MDLLAKIVKRRQLYQQHELAEAKNYLPAVRKVPLVPFFKPGKPFLIAEFKKASPSRGDFKLQEQPRQILADYLKSGVSNFSVLTERNYFKGSLTDLYFLKQHFPKAAFLRKDFLLSGNDIKISWQAGADAVLLIAEILSPAVLTELIKTAKKYKLQTLCEVHSLPELQKVLSLKIKPTAIGINARDLKTFKIDPSIPFQLKPYIPKDIFTVYESGIKDDYLVQLIGNSGFTAALIGESVVKPKNRQTVIKQFQQALKKGATQKPNYFTKLYNLKKQPLVKICGITNKLDAVLAKQNGADVLGFILAESKRKTDLNLIASLKKLDILKVAVVQDPGQKEITELKKLIKSGVIDGVQLHGQETPETVKQFEGNAYKVITPPAGIEGYLPNVLFDSAKDISKDKGQALPENVLSQLKGGWVAGGHDPDNIGSLIRNIQPQLVDVCSGVESTPGIKDQKKLIKLFKEIKSVTNK